MAEEKGKHVDEAKPGKKSANDEQKAKPPPPFPQKIKKKKEEDCFRNEYMLTFLLIYFTEFLSMQNM